MPNSPSLLDLLPGSVSGMACNSLHLVPDRVHEHLAAYLLPPTLRGANQTVPIDLGARKANMLPANMSFSIFLQIYERLVQALQGAQAHAVSDLFSPTASLNTAAMSACTDLA